MSALPSPAKSNPPRSSSGTSVPATVRVQPEPARENQIGKICSTCGSAVLQGEIVVICPLCSLPYHHECWKEIGGCGTYGCKAAPVITKAEPIATDVFTPGWVAEKKCPACHANIMANALICKHCKAVFPTERPMTYDEWANREYDGAELLKVRTKVIGQFVASALGCIFFITLPANLLALYSKEWFFDVKRLPPSLRILFYSGLGASILWGLLALGFGAYSMIFS